MSTTVIVAIVVGILGTLFIFRSRRPLRPSRDAIVPRIKNERYLDALETHPLGPGDMPVYERFVGDALIAYAIDFPGFFRMMAARDLIDLDMRLDEVRAQAIANLASKISEPRAEPVSPGVWMLVTGGTLEACLLLLDEVWDRYAETIPGELVIAVPTREIVLMTGSNSAEGLDSVREAIDEAQRRESIHQVTRNLLVRRGGRWEIFEG